jgi:hypothetical protein
MLTLGILGALLVLGLMVAGLVYAHSLTTSRVLLTTMWILAPVFLLLTFALAFTWMGSAAFFWGASMLLAALIGTVVQALEVVHRRKQGKGPPVPVGAVLR